MLARSGAFLLVVILAAAIGLLVRRQTQRRAVLERAARTQGPFHPGMLNVAKRAGRIFGWQRVMPLALVGLLVGQRAREARRREATDNAL